MSPPSPTASRFELDGYTNGRGDRVKVGADGTAIELLEARAACGDDT